MFSTSIVEVPHTKIISGNVGCRVYRSSSWTW